MFQQLAQADVNQLEPSGNTTDIDVEVGLSVDKQLFTQGAIDQDK